MAFEERLLTELKSLVAESRRPMPPPQRRPGKKRLVVSTVVAVAVAGALVLAPVFGGRTGIEAAYAVTENRDGTVIVEITSIRDPLGLEHKLEEAGVPASVHYLPQDKICGWNADRARLAEAEALPPQAGGAVRIGVSEGSFTFMVDKSRLAPGLSVVVYAEDDVPEHGQDGPTVPSVAAFVLKGNFDDCKLVDGSMEGWTFQQGYVPPRVSDEEEERAADARREVLEGESKQP